MSRMKKNMLVKIVVAVLIGAALLFVLKNIYGQTNREQWRNRMAGTIEYSPDEQVGYGDEADSQLIRPRDDDYHYRRHGVLQEEESEE
jgi:hypothetical protein